jgi:hypothetical protein
MLLACSPLGCNSPGTDPNAYNPAYPNAGYPNNGAYANPSSYSTPAYGTPGYGTPGYGTPGYANPGYAAPGYGMPPAYGAPGSTMPGYGAPGAAAPSAPATPIAPAAAVAATPILIPIGGQEAPGAQADGGLFAGQFQEGQVLEQPLTLQPGKCYTVVAAGLGVQQVDIQLVAQLPPLPATILAQSAGSGPTAVLGGRSVGCFKNPLPIAGPAKVVLRATRGQGMIAAQVYSK